MPEYEVNYLEWYLKLQVLLKIIKMQMCIYLCFKWNSHKLSNTFQVHLKLITWIILLSQMTMIKMLFLDAALKMHIFPKINLA